MELKGDDTLDVVIIDEIKSLNIEVKEMLEIIEDSLGSSLKNILSYKKISILELSEKVKLNYKTLYNIINEKSSPNIVTLVEICLALHLSPMISLMLIDKNEHRLVKWKDEHISLFNILTTRYMDTFEENLKLINKII